MADMINNEMIGTMVEGAAEAVDKIDDAMTEPVKKGVSKAVIAVVSAIAGFGAGVATKLGWDKIKDKKAQKHAIEDQEQPKIEEVVNEDLEAFDEEEDIEE